MKKTIMMAILAMLMFGGAVEADDERFHLTLDQAVELNVRYEFARERAVYDGAKELEQFLLERAKICNAWILEKLKEGKKLGYEGCDPIKEGVPATTCQKVAKKWVKRQWGCNYPELK